MRRSLVLVVLVAAVAAGAAAAATGQTMATAAKPLAGMTVNLDPGHNPGNAQHASQINQRVQAGPIRKECDTVGAATRAGWQEWRFTQQLATRVARRLRAQGAKVTFTHALGTPAWGPCITQRAAIGNRASVAVSLHADGNLAATARGFHVIKPGFVRGYTGDIVKRSGTLATFMRDELVRTGKLRTSTYIGRRGIVARTDLGGLVLSNVPKVFVEAGNLRHSADARTLRSPAAQERIARAVVAAITRWHAAETP